MILDFGFWIFDFRFAGSSIENRKSQIENVFSERGVEKAEWAWFP